MPLTQEQFQKARVSGFSTDQIIGFEKKRNSEQPVDRSEFETAEYQGGPEAPAVKQAKQEQKQAENATGALDIPIVGANVANARLLGIPGLISKATTGAEIPEASTSVGKLASDVGGLAAFGRGIEKMAIPAAKGAVSGVNDFGKAVFNIEKYSKPQNQTKLADEVQNALLSQKRNVIDKYGKEYEQIIGKSDKKVDINPAIKNFVDESQSLMQNPEFAQQVAVKNPEATKIFDMVNRFKGVNGEEISGSISAKEADNLSKYIKNLPGIKSKLSQAGKNGYHTVQWTNEDRMLLGLADDIKGSVVEAHPELAGLNKEYGQFMNSYKKVSPDFKIGNTIDKLKNYSSYDPQKQQLLEGILPKNTIDKIKEFESADKTYKVLRNLGLIGAGGIMTGAGMQKGGEIVRSVIP